MSAKNEKVVKECRREMLLDHEGCLTRNEINNVKLNRLTLVPDVFVVNVVESTRQALVENGLVTEGKLSVISDRPSGSIDGTSLWWRTVKLELSVGNDRSDSSLRVHKLASLERHGQSGVAFTGNLGSHGILLVCSKSGSGWFLNLTVSYLRSGSLGSGSLNLAVADLRDGGTGGGLNLAVSDLGNSSHGASWCLDLTVANLGNGSGSSSWCLNLAVTNLRNGGSSGSWGLDLAITDLRDGGSSGSWGLNLAITDLRDGGSCSSGGLDLPITDLRNSSSCSSGSLNLAVSDLRNSSSSGSGGLDLTVSNLRNGISLLLSTGGQGISPSSEWVDGNTEAVAVVGQGSVQRLGVWSEGGPWLGRDCGSDRCSQKRKCSEGGSVVHF